VTIGKSLARSAAGLKHSKVLDRPTSRAKMDHAVHSIRYMWFAWVREWFAPHGVPLPPWQSSEPPRTFQCFAAAKGALDE
jgi:hypothetical protein